MKNILYSTKNVKKANKVIAKMISKKGADLVLIYGVPGTGKSHYALKSFAQPGWGYYRIETMDTPRSFLLEMHRSLNYAITGNEGTVKGNSVTIAKTVISMFEEIAYIRDQHLSQEPYVFIIDEINLAIQHRKWQILELIRDFRDIAGAKIIMIGEEDTKERLERYNSHFFNRCSNFCEFEVSPIQDMLGIILGTMEVKASKEVYTLMAERAKGSLHQLTSIIQEFEVIAKQNNIKQLEVSDIVAAAQED